VTAAETASKSNEKVNLRRHPHGRKRSAPRIGAAMPNAHKPCLVGRELDDVPLAVVSMTSWDVPVPEASVAGEKVQDTPCGNPEQESTTGALKPELEVTLIRKCPDCPGSMVCEVGVVDIVKSDPTVMFTALDVLAEYVWF